MGNKCKLCTSNKFYKSYFIHGKTMETQRIGQNPEKWGCDSLQCILMAEFHLY